MSIAYPRVVWTPAQKRKLHPRRGSPNNPKSLKPLKRLTPEAWRAQGLKLHKNLLRYHSDQATAALTALYEEMMAQWNDPARQGEAPDPRHEAVVYGVTMSDGGSNKILPGLFKGWLGVANPAFVLQAIKPACEMNQWYWGKPLRDPEEFHLDKTFIGLMKMIRGELACCDDATWAASRDVAAAERAGATIWFRIITSYLFPEEAAWGDADVDAALAWAETVQHSSCHSFAPLLLGSGASIEKLEALCEADILGGSYRGEDSFAVSLVDRVGVAAAVVLARLHDRWARHYDPRKRPHNIRLLAMVESEVTVRACAERLDRWKMSSEPDITFLKAAPALAIPALEAVVASEGEHPRAAAVLKELKAAQATVHAEAFYPRASLPAPLRVSPWSAAAGKKPKKKPKPLAAPALLPCPHALKPASELPEYVREGEAEAMSEATAETDAEHLLALQALLAKNQGWYWLKPILVKLRPPARLAALRALPEAMRAEFGDYDAVDSFIFPIGLEALPLFLPTIVNATGYSLLNTTPFIGAAELAPRMAELASKKQHQTMARQWLMDWPEHTAVGLIPLAVSTRGRRQEVYLSALRFLKQSGHGEVLQRTVAAYGAEVSAFLADLELGQTFSARPPKMPAFWSPANLPPIHVQGARKPLGPDVIADIGGLMASADPLRPPPALSALREVATPASLRAFVEALLKAWEEAGGKVSDSWPVRWLGYLGGVEALAPLGDKMNHWCDHSFYRRAEQSLDAYVALGTDEAVLLLEKVRRKASRNTLQHEARRRLRAIAKARGMDYWDLLESVIPDAGLGPDGALTLDFGPRQFTAGFGADLKPWVKSGDGERLKALPNPRQTDDKVMAARSRALWTATKKTVREVAGDQVKRMGEAMTDARRWNPESWRVLAAHPLLGGLMRSLLWGDYAEDALVGTFRVDEAGELVDVADEPYTLSGEPGVVHPIELSADVLAAWGAVFGDYEIAQPIAQLGRPVRRLTPDGLTMLKQLKGATVPSARLVGLRSRGWQQGAAEGAGLVHGVSKSLRGGGISLSFDPGLDIGMSAQNMTFKEQTITAAPSDLKGINPVDLSEALLDLETLFR